MSILNYEISIECSGEKKMFDQDEIQPKSQNTHVNYLSNVECAVTATIAVVAHKRIRFAIAVHRAPK